MADATWGFDMLVHMPNGAMFTFGLKSMMLATGVPDVTSFSGRTLSVPGATPKLHVIIAPCTTIMPMVASFSSLDGGPA